MLKLKKIFRLLGASFLLCSLALHSVALAQNECKESYRAKCSKNCESATKYSFPNCVNTCLKKFCAASYDAKANSRTGSSKTSGSAGGSCKACLKVKLEGVCNTRCLNTEDPYSCKEKCSKLQCESRCSLLRNYTEETNPTKRDCGKCKKFSKSRCSKRCGKKSRPGHTACTVACVHETCLTTCFPN